MNADKHAPPEIEAFDHDENDANSKKCCGDDETDMSKPLTTAGR